MEEALAVSVSNALETLMNLKQAAPKSKLICFNGQSIIHSDQLNRRCTQASWKQEMEDRRNSSRLDTSIRPSNSTEIDSSSSSIKREA
jgi:hypothetical protein